MSRKDRIRAHYAPRIQPGRESYDIVDRAGRRSQFARFSVFVRNIDLEGKSLLDVGCGVGDLWGFLRERGVNVRYRGVDILERMVEAARARHPQAEFVCADLFGEDPLGGEQFDIVFSSGAFNLDLGNNREFLPGAVSRMLQLAGEAVVFNLLHIRTEKKYDRCVYFDPAEIVRLLEPLPCEIETLDDYLPNDFTVICRKTM